MLRNSLTNDYYEKLWVSNNNNNNNKMCVTFSVSKTYGTPRGLKLACGAASPGCTRSTPWSLVAWWCGLTSTERSTSTRASAKSRANSSARRSTGQRLLRCSRSGRDWPSSARRTRWPTWSKILPLALPDSQTITFSPLFRPKEDG